MNEPFHIARNEPVQIGEWTFVPDENELRRGDSRHRLEHRAARTLELLCRRRGQLVSREAILDAVWDGRTVSPNSLAIVISDLREALGDDARSPRFIETIAKGGYRMVANPVEDRPSVQPRPRRLAAYLAALLLLAALAAGWLLLRGPPPHATLLVSEVVNDTGQAAFDPLAKSSSTVILASAQRLSGATVIQAPNHAAASPDSGRAVVLTTRLILWSGKPTLMLSAMDRTSKAVVWSGMTSGDADRIPTDVAREMRKLAIPIATGNEGRTPLP